MTYFADNYHKPLAPRWFMPVATLGLLWNLMGVSAFIMQFMMTPEAIAELPPEEAQLYQTMPLWAMIAFAVAVFCGTAGCLLLLTRKKWAQFAFIVSFIGIVVQMYHSLYIAKSLNVYGPGSVSMPFILVIVALGLWFLAVKASKERWIR